MNALALNWKEKTMHRGEDRNMDRWLNTSSSVNFRLWMARVGVSAVDLPDIYQIQGLGQDFTT